MQPTPSRRPVARLLRRAVPFVALLACGALLPPLVVDEPPPSGDALAVVPAVLRVAPGTTGVQVALGVDAPGPLLVTARVVDVELSPDGVVTPGDRATAWATTSASTTPLRAGEVLELPVVVGEAPEDGVAALVVRGVPAVEPRTNELAAAADGAPVEVVAVLLADGPARPPRLALERDGEAVRVRVEVSRPSVLGVAASARGVTRAAAERVAVPGRPVRVELALPGAPWPLAAEVVDDTGATTGARLGPDALVLAATAAALLALVAALLVVVRRRRRARGRGARGRGAR